MAKKQVRFEEALEQLEKIVYELEEGEIGLEESLKRYEDGVKLLRQCYGILQKAERRIELVTGVDDDGQPTTEPFDATATAERAEGETSKRQRSAKSAAEGEKTEDEQELQSRQLF